MNILFILHTDGLAGANRSALQLIKGITGTDESVHFYVMVPLQHDTIAPILTDLGCTVIAEDYTNCTTVLHGVRQALRYYSKRIHYARIYEDVKSLNIDIVHTNSSVCDLGAYLARRIGVPHFWHVREHLDYYKMAIIRPVYYKKMIESPNTLVVCISQYIEKYIKSRFKKADSTVVYNSFIVPKRKIHISKEDYELIIAGIIVKNKGIEDAINALNIIVNDYGMKNVHLNIVGTSIHTAEYELFLKGMVTEYKLTDNIVFLPFTDDIDEIRAECDIALQCSVMEGMGRVTIEAMLNDLLVIGARSGATEELIQNDYNGWLYEPGDAVGLAQRIRMVIRLDETEKELIRLNAYRWAAESFSIEAIAKQMLGIYANELFKNSL